MLGRLAFSGLLKTLFVVRVISQLIGGILHHHPPTKLRPVSNFSLTFGALHIPDVASSAWASTTISSSLSLKAACSSLPLLEDILFLSSNTFQRLGRGIFLSLLQLSTELFKFGICTHLVGLYIWPPAAEQTGHSMVSTVLLGCWMSSCLRC